MGIFAAPDKGSTWAAAVVAPPLVTLLVADACNNVMSFSFPDLVMQGG